MNQKLRFVFFFPIDLQFSVKAHLALFTPSAPASLIGGQGFGHGILREALPGCGEFCSAVEVGHGTRMELNMVRSPDFEVRSFDVIWRNP